MRHAGHQQAGNSDLPGGPSALESEAELRGMMTGFREQGSGIPLMLLHGISSGAASHKQMALNGFRVLAWDMPGYGESPMLAAERANAGITPMRWRRCLTGLAWQAVLVGHSLGALVASAFAAKYPDRVLHLVLADAAQGYGRRAGAARAGLAQSRAADGTRRRNPRADPRRKTAASRRA